MGNFEYISNDININEEYAEKLMENLNMKSSVIILFYQISFKFKT